MKKLSNLEKELGTVKMAGLGGLVKSWHPNTYKKKWFLCPRCGLGATGNGKHCKPCTFDIRQEQIAIYRNTHKRKYVKV